MNGNHDRLPECIKEAMETSELLTQFRDADGNLHLEFIPNMMLCGVLSKTNVDLQIFRAMNDFGGRDG